MTDIVERLRGNAIGNPARIPWPHRLLHDAAEEIERLRAALKKAYDEVDLDAMDDNHELQRQLSKIASITRAALAQGGDNAE